MYITVQKGLVRFDYLIINTEKKFYFDTLIKIGFQQPFLMSSVSHDHSEGILIWWFAAYKYFWSCCLFFCEIWFNASLL